MKFDYVVGNPPFDGQRSLHQEIFVRSVELLKDNGQIIFIQPATAVYSNKENQSLLNRVMQAKLSKYETFIEIQKDNVFDDTILIIDLMITVLTKRLVKVKEIQEFIYKNGDIYKNIAIKDINITKFPPEIFASIKNKYEIFIYDYGNLYDIEFKNSWYDAHEDTICISRFAGHAEGSDNSKFFSFYSSKSKNKIDYKYGLCCITEEKENMYDYLDSNIAKFGLAISKYSLNIANGELKTVPRVDFSRKYTNEELYQMIGLAKNEIDYIERFFS